MIVSRIGAVGLLQELLGRGAGQGKTRPEMLHLWPQMGVFWGDLGLDGLLEHGSRAGATPHAATCIGRELSGEGLKFLIYDIE